METILIQTAKSLMEELSEDILEYGIGPEMDKE